MVTAVQSIGNIRPLDSLSPKEGVTIYLIQPKIEWNIFLPYCQVLDEVTDEDAINLTIEDEDKLLADEVCRLSFYMAKICCITLLFNAVSTLGFHGNKTLF